MTKAVLVFSGFNPRAVVSFLRTLTESDVRFGIIACTENDFIFNTEYAQHVTATRQHRPLDLRDLLACIEETKAKLDADSYVIAPSTEALNRFLLANKSEFERVDCEITLVNKELYERLSDKQTFGELCADNDIEVPEGYPDAKSATTPFVAKPKKFFSESGDIYVPVLIHTQEEREEFLHQYKENDFYYQQFVSGDSYYLLYYFYKDGSVVKLSQQNFVQQPGGKSIIAAESSDFHNADESQKYERLFREANFYGLVMVEVRRQQDRNYMIEANPRFWGPSQLFVDAGVNFFSAFLFDNGLIDKKPHVAEPGQPIKYFWYGGIIESIADGRGIAYHSITAEDLARDLPHWLETDIYNRDDTRLLFKLEAKL